MPHLRLEYSSNVKEKIDLEKLFVPCHEILKNTVNADVLRCQSRAVSTGDFFIGDGSPDTAFIYLEVRLKDGRTSVQMQEAGQQLLHALKSYFSRSVTELNLQLSVNVTEFCSAHYFKLESSL